MGVQVIDAIISAIRSVFDILQETEIIEGFSLFDVFVDSTVMFALAKLLFGSDDSDEEG